jgi:hypothetical protein
MLQSAARELMKKELVAKCYRALVPGKLLVDVLYSPKVERAHYKHLQICASVWMCPICSAKITERRRVELSSVLSVHDDLDYALVSFTLQHDNGHSLRETLEVLLEGYRFLKAGKRWKEFVAKYGLVGSVRALEVTQGDRGWHPHLHVLFFFRKGVRLNGIRNFLKRRWMDVMDRNDRLAGYQHGVDFRTAQDDVAEYVSKFGDDSQLEKKWRTEHELTKGPVKVSRSAVGRTPLQLLADYVDGDDRSGELWQEYARQFKGKRQLVWSRGLRKRLGLDREETDDEIAKREDEESFLLASLSFRQWKVILANDARGEVLEIASRNDPDALNEFLKLIGAKNEV